MWLRARVSGGSAGRSPTRVSLWYLLSVPTRGSVVCGGASSVGVTPGWCTTRCPSVVLSGLVSASTVWWLSISPVLSSYGTSRHSG